MEDNKVPPGWNEKSTTPASWGRKEVLPDSFGAAKKHPVHNNAHSSIANDSKNIVCETCGSQVADEAVFCHFCGTTIVNNERTVSPDPASYVKIEDIAKYDIVLTDVCNREDLSQKAHMAIAYVLFEDEIKRVSGGSDPDSGVKRQVQDEAIRKAYDMAGNLPATLKRAVRKKEALFFKERLAAYGVSVSLRYCPNCGGSLNNMSDRCATCGEAAIDLSINGDNKTVVRALEPMLGESNVSCPKCGTLSQGTADFCRKCGSHTGSQAFPASRTDLPPQPHSVPTPVQASPQTPIVPTPVQAPPQTHSIPIPVQAPPQVYSDPTPVQAPPQAYGVSTPAQASPQALTEVNTSQQRVTNGTIDIPKQTEKTGSKMTTMAVVIAVLATVIVSAGIFVFFYFRDRDTDDNDTTTVTQQTSVSEPTPAPTPAPMPEATPEPLSDPAPETERETKTAAGAPFFPDQSYLGEWYDAGENILTILAIDNNTVMFDFFLYRTYSLSAIARLENDLIKFEYHENGYNYMAGILEFNEDSISIVFNESDFMYIYAGDRYFFSNHGPLRQQTSTDGEELFHLTQTNNSVVFLNIHWDDGRSTFFSKDEYGGWFMNSRDGDYREVSPEFKLIGTTVEIRFPTTTRVYKLYDDGTGIFGDEVLWWNFDRYYG